MPLGFARCQRDGDEGHWLFSGCIRSKDPRYRALIKMFSDNGLGGIVGSPEAKAASALSPG